MRPVAYVLAGSALMAGCGSNGSSATTHQARATTTTIPPREVVIHAYAAAVQAIADAEIHNDPQWPALLATVVNPELGHVQGFVRLEMSLGYHSRGTAYIVRSAIANYSPTQATVTACIHDAVLAYQANGAPVPGNAGTPNYGVTTATLIPTSPGHWALQDATAKQFPTAQAAGSACAS